MKLKANKKVIGLTLSLIIAAVFLLINPVHAGWGNDILAGICGAIVSALGWVLVQIMGILVYFAQYNGFIQSAAVINGWVIVRDVCNMFFVLILLIIAFATILQIEEYNYKKWLPKLILMAILINFSKMICGLLIDAAQIVMLTFVNSFKDIAGGNLTSALGIKNWQTMGDMPGEINWQITASLLLAVIYVIISIVVITAMLAMIAMRIVMLWIYIVLSPLAYLMSAFPGGKKYAAQWWSQFTQNLVVGPVLAFFIWLSFTSLATFSSGQFKNANSADTTSGIGAANTCVGNACGFAASDVLVQFIIAIGMLLGGMKITQEIGGVAGSAAGAGMNRLNKMGKATMRGIGGAAGGVAGTVTGYNFAKRRFNDWQKKSKEKMQAKSDLVYETAKGGIKGAAFGAKNVIVGGFKGAEKTPKQREEDKLKYKAFKDQNQTLEKDGKKYEFDPTTNKYKYEQRTNTGRVIPGTEEFAKGANGEDMTKMTDKEAKSYEKSERKVNKKEEKKNKKDEEKRLYEAYSTGVYKDENGDDFEYDEAKKQYIDQKTRKVAQHKVKDLDGNEHLADVQKMDDGTARFKDGMKDGMRKSDALRSEIKEHKTSEEQKVFEGAGVSSTELKRIMNDTGVNKNRRLAAAMTLAIKNGFKNNNHAAGRQDVSNAKSLIGNNDIILKKFNEAVNKSSAHLNYDLESDKGKKEFKQGMDEGKIDGYNQDSSAYKSSALVKTLKDYSGFDFADNISRVSQKSAQHRNNVNDGLLEAKNQDLTGGAPLFDTGKQELNAYAKLIARLSGNMKNAFSGADGTFDEDAATKYMEIAKPSWLANFDTDQLKKNGTNDGLVDSINRAMANGIQVNNITSLEKTGSNPDMVRRLLGAIEELGDTEKNNQVQASNILKSISPIKPD